MPGPDVCPDCGGLIATNGVCETCGADRELGARWNQFVHLVLARQYTEALSALDELVTTPDLEREEIENLHAYRADLLNAHGRYRDALEAIDLSLAGSPRDISRLYVRARVLMNLGRWDAVRACVGVIIGVDPDAVAAAALLEELARRMISPRS